jgi:hypothetical protein
MFYLSGLWARTPVIMGKDWLYEEYEEALRK